MFITIKVDKHRVILFTLILLIMIIVATIGYKFFLNANDTKNPINPLTNKNIVKFVNSYGWDVDNNPVEHEKFKFPNQFDQTYKRYNQYQLAIGKDLTPYKGESVVRVTYKVLNYILPDGFENQQVYADILLYNDLIIGGDLKTNEINGFMVSLNNKTFKEITGVSEAEYN